MSDDLVKRLWESDDASKITNQAARRIEALQAERDKEKTSAFQQGYKNGKAAGDAFGASMRDYVQKLEARTLELEAERDAAVLAEREEIANRCHYHTMDTVTDARKAEYAGSYVAGEYSPESNARHHGMGYAEAIRARSNKEREGAA